MVEDRRTVLLELLLGKPEPRDYGSLSTWLPAWRAANMAHKHCSPYVAAIAAALQADRMAWAFFSGYQGALAAAFPDHRGSTTPKIASLGANESGRRLTEIDTMVHGVDGLLRLIGRKSWVLAGIDDLDLYVLARMSNGPAKGPGSLRVVRVPRSAMGVEMGDPRPQAVVPELEHCQVVFNNVLIDRAQLIAGDGYADYVKPFRLREDVHVTGCTLAYLLAQGHVANWPTRWRQRCVAVIVTLGECAVLSPTDPNTELFTAGALAIAGEVIAQSDALWSQYGSIALDRWYRDKPILGLGKEARRQRVQAAWAKRGWPATDESDQTTSADA